MADTKISELTASTLINDADNYPSEQGGVTKRNTWSLFKSTLKTYFDTLYGKALVGINTQTGTTYTLVLTDAGKRVRCNNANAITLTVPQNSSVAFAIGTWVEVEQIGAGVVTSAEDTNVTLNGGLKTWGQYTTIRYTKVDTNTWTVDGGSE